MHGKVCLPRAARIAAAGRRRASWRCPALRAALAARLPPSHVPVAHVLHSVIHPGGAMLICGRLSVGLLRKDNLHCKGRRRPSTRVKVARALALLGNCTQPCRR